MVVIGGVIPVTFRLAVDDAVGAFARAGAAQTLDDEGVGLLHGFGSRARGLVTLDG